MSPQEAAAQAAIRASFAVAVRYTGAGLTAASILAIKSDIPADDFQGPGSTLRQISFEIGQADLPASPGKGNTITEDDGAGAVWRVNDITRRDDVAAWSLIVERTS